jgi:hypothetical protein
MSPDVSLVDLLDRMLSTGVVLTGDITLAIADVDLVQISLRALITSIAAHDQTDACVPTSLSRR